MSVRITKRDGNFVYYEGMGGDTITENVTEIIELLRHSALFGNPYIGVLTFNGTQVTLHHDSDVQESIALWKQRMDQKSELYRQSPEYKKREEEAALRAVASQRNMDGLVAEIKKILTDWAAIHGGSDIQPNGDIALRLMVLFKTYIEEADSIHIESYSGEILPLLEAAGYKENEFTGGNKPVKQYETRAWLVGQMINMMKSHGCSHPGLAHMVEKYKLHLNP